MVSFIAQSYTSFEIFKMMAMDWDLEFIQLGKGSFHAEFTSFGDNDFRISEVCYNKLLQQHGTGPSGYYTFAVNHKKSAPIRWRKLNFPLDSIIVFPENNELQAISQPGHRPFIVSISKSFISTVARVTGLPDPKRFIVMGGVALCDARGVEAIRRLLTALCESARKLNTIPVDLFLTDDLKWKIARLCLLTLASSKNVKPRPKLLQKHQITKRVLEYIDTDLSANRTIPELCEIAEVNERTLRNIFYDLYSLSPKRYLNRYRLNVVRKALIEMDSPFLNISDIANQYGFWHMGQFAKDYRQIFNELPSDTLEKVK